MDCIGSPVINVTCLTISWTSSMAHTFQLPLVLWQLCKRCAWWPVHCTLQFCWSLFTAFPACFCNEEPAIITV